MISSIKGPWDDLASWLSAIGNRDLAAKLMRPDAAAFYATISQYRRKAGSMRQRKYRQRKNNPVSRAWCTFWALRRRGLGRSKEKCEAYHREKPDASGAAFSIPASTASWWVHQNFCQTA